MEVFVSVKKSRIMKSFKTIIENNLKKLGIFEKSTYLCTDKSRPLPIRTAYPAGHFLYIDMRYTKQAMTLVQHIQTLQGRGLIRQKPSGISVSISANTQIQTCHPFGRRWRWFRWVNSRSFSITSVSRSWSTMSHMNLDWITISSFPVGWKVWPHYAIIVLHLLAECYWC